MYTNNSRKNKCANNTNHKSCVISLPNTIIEPHAMMIEITDTSIASTAMFAGCPTIAIAIFTVEYFVVLWSEGYFFVVAGPFVVIDYPISRISAGCYGC